jgi:glycerol-3-phosphate acyltransferase PlsX
MAYRQLGVEITLVGQQEIVKACLEKEGCTEADKIEIVDARDVITMEDDPSTATRRKKDASMTVALNLLRDGQGDALVSAGSTGALLTGATLIVKRINGIRRAALSPVLPNGGKGVVLIDCGANVDCTPEYLLQFGYMGSFYAQKMLGIDKPRVGLANVGTEETKGGQLQHEAFALLKEAGDAGRINFIGNVEGNDLFSGRVDVVVADGFTGNIMLKTAESTIKFIMGNLKGIFYKNLKNKLAAAAIKGDLSAMKKTLDVKEVGGTVMLGISKPVIKAHGSSDARCIFAAARQAVACIEGGVAEKIKENIEYMKIG